MKTKIDYEKLYKDIANELYLEFYEEIDSVCGDTVAENISKICAIICCNEIIAQYIDKNCETARCYKEVKRKLEKYNH